MIGNVSNDASQLWAWLQTQATGASDSPSSASGTPGNVDAFSLGDCTADGQAGVAGPPASIASDMLLLLQSDGSTATDPSANGAAQQAAGAPHHHHHHHHAAATDPTQTQATTTDPTQASSADAVSNSQDPAATLST
jgi:hypothetical protein